MQIDEALATAIEHEHRVRDHYRRASDAVLHPAGKKILTVLADEEQRHVEYLESRMDEWRKTGAITAPELPTALPGAEWIEKARRRLSRPPSPDLAVKEGLELMKVALDLERSASAFYRQLVDTLGVEHRQLFARFLDIEAGHVGIVQAEIDALTGIGTWFDVMEFSLEAG